MGWLCFGLANSVGEVSFDFDKIYIPVRWGCTDEYDAQDHDAGGISNHMIRLKWPSTPHRSVKSPMYDPAKFGSTEARMMRPV